MAYDPACLDLAEHFLGAARAGMKAELAQHIQDAVESWLQGKEAATRHAVFSRAECVFNYCPHPDLCRDACITSAGRRALSEGGETVAPEAKDAP